MKISIFYIEKRDKGKVDKSKLFLELVRDFYKLYVVVKEKRERERGKIDKIKRLIFFVLLRNFTIEQHEIYILLKITKTK